MAVNSVRHGFLCNNCCWFFVNWCSQCMWGFVLGPCFAMLFIVSILVWQSSHWGRGSWLLHFLNGVHAAIWISMFCVFSLLCHGFICDLWLCYFLIIPYLFYFFCILMIQTYLICLTLYSMVTPFDAFEILCIWTYYGKSFWSKCFIFHNIF